MSILILHERTEGKAKALRREGWAPVGYIVRGKPTMNMKAPEAELLRAIQTASGGGMVDVQFEGEKKKRNAVIKLVEKGILDKKIQTVVLMDVNLSEELTVDVPVVGVGIPGPAKRGEGVLDQPTNHIKIRGRAGDLPGQIDVDVSELEIGDHIAASELKLPEGMELVSNADATIFALHLLRGAEPTAAEAAEGAVEGEAASVEPERIESD